MLIAPPIVALQLIALGVAGTVLLASGFAWRILRRWDIGSGSELQLRLERQLLALVSGRIEPEFERLESGNHAKYNNDYLITLQGLSDEKHGENYHGQSQSDAGIQSTAGQAIHRTKPQHHLLSGMAGDAGRRANRAEKPARIAGLFRWALCSMPNRSGGMPGDSGHYASAQASGVVALPCAPSQNTLQSSLSSLFVFGGYIEVSGSSGNPAPP